MHTTMVAAGAAALLLLAWAPRDAAAHSSLILPKPRNAIDSNDPRWARPEHNPRPALRGAYS